MALLFNSTICLWIMKKTNIQKSLIGILVFSALFVLSVIIFDDIILFVVCNLMVYGFFAVYQPIIQAVLAIVCVNDNAVMVGLYNSIKSLGMVLGSIIVGFAYAISSDFAFFLTFVCTLLALILAVVNYKQIKCDQHINK